MFPLQYLLKTVIYIQFTVLSFTFDLLNSHPGPDKSEAYSEKFPDRQQRRSVQPLPVPEQHVLLSSHVTHDVDGTFWHATYGHCK